MKKYFVSAISLALLATPAGFAFANEQVNVGSSVGVHTELLGDHQLLTDEREQGENGSSSLDMENDGNEDGSVHLGATTSLERGDRDEDSASSTRDSDDQNEGNLHFEDQQDRGVFTTFLAWLFGQPATTTVGQIQSELQASTTASTTLDLGGEGHHEGFFLRLLGFFGLGEGG